ncbi:L-lactate dehydrogenase [Latilactobacillus sakei]
MNKVAIIGIGHVGSTVAYTLVSRRICSELVLFDQKPKLAEAERNDLEAGQVDHTGFVKITANDESQLATCDLVIFSAGDISILEHSDDRFDELTYTKTAVAQWAPKLKAANFKGILLNITNPCDVITQYLQALTGFPKERVLGTGTTLDTARMQVAVGHYLNVAPNSVQGYVLGEHGNSQFVAWSGVHVGGQPLATQLSPEQLAQFEADARQGAWEILSGKGYTSYGIANQAAHCAAAILQNTRQVLPVSNFDETVQCYVGHPAMVGAAGVLQDYPSQLTTAEQQKWQTSIDTIKHMYAAI